MSIITVRNKQYNEYEVYFDKTEYDLFKSFTLNPQLELIYNIERSIYTSVGKKTWNFYLTKTFISKFDLKYDSKVWQ